MMFTDDELRWLVGHIELWLDRNRELYPDCTVRFDMIESILDKLRKLYNLELRKKNGLP